MAAPRAASSPSLAIFTLLEKAALFETAPSAPEPELRVLLLAGMFPLVLASPSPGVHLQGSDERKNVLRQTALEHGVHVAATCRVLSSQGFLFRGPGLRAEHSFPTGPQRFCLISPQCPLASGCFPSMYTKAHSDTLCTSASACPPGGPCFLCPGQAAFSPNHSTFFRLLAPLPPALPLSPGSYHPGPYPQEKLEEVGGHCQASGEAHLQPH